MTLRTLAAIAGALTLVLAACGDDDETSGTTTTAADDGGGGGGGGELSIIAQDIKFPQGSYEVEGGTVDVTYENDGNTRHTLVVEGVKGFRLEVDKHGDVDEGSVELSPGDYTIFCDVAGHREAGMEAELKVS